MFQSIALHDTLTFSRQPRPVPHRLRRSDVPGRPTRISSGARPTLCGRRRAAAARRATSRFDLNKRIPLQAGLGGGSSDAAAALRALARSGASTRRAAARRSPASLGADVPFFLEGGTALGLDRGDLLFPLADRPAAWVVAGDPGFGVSTPEAYGWWDDDRQPSREGDRLRRRRSAAAGRARLGLPAAIGTISRRRSSARHPEIARIVVGAATGRRDRMPRCRAAARPSSGCSNDARLRRSRRAVSACAHARLAGRLVTPHARPRTTYRRRLAGQVKPIVYTYRLRHVSRGHS